jgi:plasmid replication initiation protein
MILHNTPKIFHSKTPKVYKIKKLNAADFGNFTHNDYQVFLHLVSKIGGVDQVGKYLQPEQLQREHILTAKEFSEIFSTDIHNSYGFLKRAVDKLMKTDIKIEKVDGKGIIRINVCSQAEYNKNEGSITIEFTDRIMPYIAQATQKFTLYNLKEIANFRSLYTTRLYELIQDFKETGWMLKSVDQLREAFAVGQSFKLYADFKRYTFGHACQEINSNYAMGLRFEEIKEGRKVTAVKFFFKRTQVYKAIHQHTGVSKNIYKKPEFLNKEKKNKTKKQIFDLENQLPKSLNNAPKSMKDVMSSFLTKLFPNKK